MADPFKIGDRVRLRLDSAGLQGKALSDCGIVVSTMIDMMQGPMLLVQRDGLKGKAWYAVKDWEPAVTGSEREALLQSIADAPNDPVPKMVYADWLGDRGDESLSIAYRFMAKHNKRPYFRTQTGLMSRWSWFVGMKDDSGLNRRHRLRLALEEPYEESAIDSACLETPLMAAVTNRIYCPQWIYYTRQDTAIAALGNGLMKLREIVNV